MAWFAAFAVVFVPLLAWNIFQLMRREGTINANIRMVAASAASVDSQIKSFFRNSLSNPCYGISKCYAFGSVVGQYPICDVDIIVQFDSSKEYKVRIYRERMRNIESKFQEIYALKAHVQTFSFH